MPPLQTVGSCSTEVEEGREAEGCGERKRRCGARGRTCEGWSAETESPPPPASCEGQGGGRAKGCGGEGKGRDGFATWCPARLEGCPITPRLDTRVRTAVSLARHQYTKIKKHWLLVFTDTLKIELGHSHACLARLLSPLCHSLLLCPSWEPDWCRSPSASGPGVSLAYWGW